MLSALFLFAARVVAAVIQLRVVEKIWGGQYSGLNALSNQVLLYITLLELGLGQAAISLMFEPIASRQTERVSALLLALRTDLRRLVVLGSCALPLVAVYARLIHTTVSRTTVVCTLEMIALSGLMQLSGVHLQAYLNAAERIDRVNVILGLGYLVKTFIGLTISVYTHNYLWLPAVILALTAAELAGLHLAFNKAFPEFSVVPIGDASDVLRGKAKYALFHKVGGLAYYQSDFIILSLTTSLLILRDYARYQYISGAILSMVGMLLTALTASLARCDLTASSTAREQQYFRFQFVASLTGAGILLGFIFCSPTVVRYAFGVSEPMPWQTLALFGTALFLNVVKGIDDAYVVARGRFEVGYWLPLIESPAYVIFGVLLSKAYGFKGILMASILSNVVIQVLAKGLVLAGPVFCVTRQRWFLLRFRNMTLALLLIVPIGLVCAFTAQFFQKDIVRLLVTLMLLLGYMAIFVERGLPKPSSAAAN